MSKYVIIGGSAGGIGAVEAIREVDPMGTITVISEESFPQYSRPMISDFLSGEATLEKMKYRGDQFWEKNEIRVLTGRKAVSLDIDDRCVGLEGGDRIDFEKLLIATGGKPFIPKIAGTEKEGVFTFTTFSDAKRIASKTEAAKRGVVIGGGLIGVSVAEALTKCGLEVTIVELQDRILNLILDETASKIVEKAIREAGVAIVPGQTVKQILGKHDNEGVVGGVVLVNSEEIQCDLVIIAIGVIPRTELVTGTGVEVKRGIIVDRFMRTNVPGVYACGDVVEAYDFVLDEIRPLPLWPVASLGGRIAGYNMAGKNTEFPGGTAMNALKYYNTHIISAGIANTEEGDGHEVLADHDLARGLYRKIVLKEDLIVGMTFVNEIERTGIIFYLMKNRINVGHFKQKLLSQDFGLASLPKELRRKMLRGS